jgi:hypothetical protein
MNKIHIILMAIVSAKTSLLMPAQAQADDKAVLIPYNTTSSPAPQKAPPLEINPDEILTSHEITKPDQKITIQELVPQPLASLPQPVSTPPTNEQKAELRQRQINIGKRRLSMLSCTVHNGSHTHIRWTSQGRIPVERFEAWSNVNFHHLAGTGNFKKGDTNHHIMFGIGDENHQQSEIRATRFNRVYVPPQIPNLPENPINHPTFIITKGNPLPEDLAAIEGLHELYQIHHELFTEKWIAKKAETERLAQERAANPPDPTPDLIIRHWTPLNPSGPEAESEGGSQ